MFKKILISSLALISSLSLIQKEDLLADATKEQPHSLLTCYNSPRTTDSQGKDYLDRLISSGKIKESVNVPLTGFGPGNSVAKKGTTKLYVDRNLFFERHIVIYNGREVTYTNGKRIEKVIDHTYDLRVSGSSNTNPLKQRFDGRSVCGIVGKRYLGFDEKGFAVVDPLSIPDATSSKSYFLNRTFLLYPSDSKSFWSKLSSAQRGTKPNPILIGSNVPQGSSAERKEILSRAVDTFQFSIANSRTKIVDFKGLPPMSFKQLRGNLDKTNSVINKPLGSVLEKYSVLVSRPSDYTPGVFYLYTKYGKGSYYYSSNFILQKKDPFVPEDESLDVKSEVILPSNSKGTKVINGVSYAVYDAVDFNPSVNYSLSYTSSTNYSLRGNCTLLKNTNSSNNLLPCKSRADGSLISDPKSSGIRIYPINDVANKNVLDIRNKANNTLLDFTLNKSNPSKKISLKEMFNAYGGEIKATESGLYVVKSFIPYYMYPNSSFESDYNNNRDEKIIYLNGIPNVSLSGEMSNSFPAGYPLDTKLTVTNDYKNAITDKITYIIKNRHGDTVVNETIPYSNISVGSKFDTLLKDKNIILDPDDYTLEASIPVYDDEGVKTDNSFTARFSVDMFIPENTICDFINTPNMKTTNVEVLKYASKGKEGISRTCIGYLPNHPSTVVEDGQKTFFYVSYRALPFPIPSYRVSNLDIHGVKQKIVMREPRDAMGSCDASKDELNTTYQQKFNAPYTALENCTLKDTFYYFPSAPSESIKDVANSNTSNAAKDWLGPYELGSYDYHHYAYRGRLVPNKITLDVKVYDPEYNAISFENNIGLGNLTFYLEKQCFYLEPQETQILDIKDECKLIQLYLPGNPRENQKNVETYFSLPFDNKPYSIPDEEHRANFLNVGLHAITLDIKEDYGYIYQRDLGAEWQGKDGVLTWDGSKTVVGPVNTTTMKNTPQGHWIQNSRIPYNGTASANKSYNSYFNHCYIFTNAVPWQGNWKDGIFTPDNLHSCFHDSSSDYYYWMFYWSENRVFNNFYMFNLNSNFNTPTTSGFTQTKKPGNDNHLPFDPGIDMSLPDNLSIIDDSIKNSDEYLNDSGLFEDEKSIYENNDDSIDEYIDHVEPPDSNEVPYDGLGDFDEND